MKNHWLDKKDEEYTLQLAKAITEVREHYEGELKSSEEVAAKGYAQAYSIIETLMKKLEDQREMYEKRLEEGFNEAFEMLQAERRKTETLEVDLYTEYDKKIQDIRRFMIDKVADYLDKKVLEEGAAKVRAENTAEQIVEEAITGVRPDPVPKSAEEQLSHLQKRVTQLEARNMRLQAQVDKGESERIETLSAQLKLLEARNMRLNVQLAKAQEKNAPSPAPVVEDEWPSVREWECDV